MLRTDVKTELDRQTDTLVALGYADLAGVSEDALRTAATSLADPLAAVAAGTSRAPEPERASFVLVVEPRAACPVSERVPLLRLGGRAGHAEPALRRRRHLRRRGRGPRQRPCTPWWGSSAARSSAASGPSEAARHHRGPRPEHADHRRGARLPARRARGPGEEQVLPHRGLPGHGRAGARPCGSPTGRRTWAGAGENNHHTWLGVASAEGRGSQATRSPVR